MLEFSSTKNYVGIQFWGSQQTLEVLYNWIYKFILDNESGIESPWESETMIQNPRTKIMSSFAYEIRKAMQGSRLVKEVTIPYLEEQSYVLGSEVSFVEYIFFINTIKANMLYKPTSKKDIAILLLLEDGFERVCKEVDYKTGIELSSLLDNQLDVQSPYIFHMMCEAQLEFLKMGGGKRAFKTIPALVSIAEAFTQKHSHYVKTIEKTLKRLNCTIDEITVNDEGFDYEAVKW